MLVVRDRADVSLDFFSAGQVIVCSRKGRNKSFPQWTCQECRYFCIAHVKIIRD